MSSDLSLECVHLAPAAPYGLAQVPSPLGACSKTLSGPSGRQARKQKAVKKPSATQRTPRRVFFGGPKGIRTLDLCIANAALSQLSYRPVLFPVLFRVFGTIRMVSRVLSASWFSLLRSRLHLAATAPGANASSFVG